MWAAKSWQVHGPLRAGSQSSAKEVPVLESLQGDSSVLPWRSPWWPSVFLQSGAFPTVGMVVGGQPVWDTEWVDVTLESKVCTNSKCNSTEMPGVYKEQDSWKHPGYIRSKTWDFGNCAFWRGTDTTHSCSEETLTFIPYSLTASVFLAKPLSLWSLADETDTQRSFLSVSGKVARIYST